jgi:hypothetical protein
VLYRVEQDVVRVWSPQLSGHGSANDRVPDGRTDGPCRSARRPTLWVAAHCRFSEQLSCLSGLP